MKVIACLFVVGLATAAKLPSGDDAAATAVKEAFDAHIADGVYKYDFETSNGIKASQSGSIVPGEKEPGAGAVGSFSYTAPDGTVISLSYKADGNGFQPEGAHLPVAPPAPEYVAELIAKAAKERKA